MTKKVNPELYDEKFDNLTEAVQNLTLTMNEVQKVMNTWVGADLIERIKKLESVTKNTPTVNSIVYIASGMILSTVFLALIYLVVKQSGL